MNRVSFFTERSTIMGMHDAFYPADEEDLLEALCEAVVGAIDTQINVQVSGVTMFLAAWRDPEHWSEDWAKELDCDIDDVPERVADLLYNAVEVTA